MNGRELLPTKEQIAAIDDLEAVEFLRDEVIEHIRQIEVDLEFRTDENADEEWERRARGALTAHRICLGNLNHRLNWIRGGVKSKKNDQDAERMAVKAADKAARRELQLVTETQSTERRRIALEAAKATSERDKAIAIERRKEKSAERLIRLSWLSHFHNLARDMLAPGEYASLCEGALKSQTEALEAELKELAA